jgi:hypothetical protein
LYQGRSFREATRAARLARTSLQIVSAGLGVVDENEEIPAYSLTVSTGSRDGVSGRVKGKAGFKSDDWWTALVGRWGARSLARCVRRSPHTVFVVALSQPYLRMVAQDLLRLRPGELRRVRLIGPRRESAVPERLRELWMPYDARLDGKASSIRGTEADFPQRAAVHFVRLANRKGGRRSVGQDRKLVEGALRAWPRRRPVVRKKLSDVLLRRAVSRALRDSRGRVTLALRILRDKRRIACEENRFRRICRELGRKQG